METRLEKYYQPDISEFHVGFEYEFETPIGTWKSIKVNATCSLHNACLNLRFPDHDDTYGIRVKYLDRSDIESLGFKYEAKGDYFVKNKNPGTSFLIYTNFDKKILDIVHCPYLRSSRPMFTGPVKNRSELLTLLKQLGIDGKEEDTKEKE